MLQNMCNEKKEFEEIDFLFNNETANDKLFIEYEKPINNQKPFLENAKFSEHLKSQKLEMKKILHTKNEDNRKLLEEVLKIGPLEEKGLLQIRNTPENNIFDSSFQNLRVSEMQSLRSNPLKKITEEQKRQILYRPPNEDNVSWITRKKRRSNPLLWQYFRGPEKIHPSRLSSLEFIRGKVSSNQNILPMILQSKTKINEEYKGVILNFKQEVLKIDFNNVTVHQLKQLMKDYGLNHTGKKHELIKRCKDTLDSLDQMLGVQEKIKKDVEVRQEDVEFCYF